MSEPPTSSPGLRPVVVVTGPTAAGKTGIAIDLALRFGGEIVNADSMQVYRYLDIGTAKPSLAQQAQVTHHLLDVVLPNERYSAGRYGCAAREAATRIHGRGRIVVLAGGTGLYIRAFLEGLLDAGGADLALRDQLEREHAEAVAAGEPDRLHRRLADADPDAARSIHPNDVRRIVRALEIRRTTGGPASRLRAAHGFRDRCYRVLHLAVDPGVEALAARIDARCRNMIDAGLLREVRDLRERGYGPELPPLQSIGYRHMAPVVDGSDTLANALELMQRDTRRFARRQRTWLRAVDDVVRVHPDDGPGIARRVETFLAARD